jgi:predicted PurR-regulated permease PerM
MSVPVWTIRDAVRNGPERTVTPILFILLVLTVSYAFFLLVRPFLAVIAWASVLAISMQPLYSAVRRRLAPGTAALVVIGAVVASVICPACIFFLRLSRDILSAANRLASAPSGDNMHAVQAAQDFWLRVQHRFPQLQGVDPIESVKASLLAIGKNLTSTVGAVAQNIFAFVGMLILILLTLFFLLRDGPKLVALLRRLSPLESNTTDLLFAEIRVLTQTSVVAVFLIAIVQGTLGGVTTAILGLPGPLIWGAGFGVCSLVPVVGTSLVWIPAAIWLAVAGHEGKAAIMVVVSLLIITQADNVLRPALLSGRSKLSFEISMFSVIGGVAAFGMLGLILGPIVTALLTALVELYLENKERSPTA